MTYLILFPILESHEELHFSQGEVCFSKDGI